MIEAVQAKDRYLAQFAELEGRLNGRRNATVQSLRRAALARFEELGFPTTRQEEWRYTSVAPIARTEFRPSADRGTPDGRARQELEWLLAALGLDGDAPRLVFVNGRLAGEWSRAAALPAGVRVASLVEALERDAAVLERHLGRYASYGSHPFVALNTAFVQDGAFIEIGRGRVVETPLHLIFLSTATDEPVVSHPRVLVLAGEDAQAAVVETYLGAEGAVYWTNAVTEIVAAEGAVVDHYRLQRESGAAYHVATVQAQLARGSNVTSHSFTLGGALTRNDVNAVLAAEGVECTLNGLYLGAGTQHVDNHTRIEHARPHCVSHELYKGILDGQARGVFNGKIYVHPDAQKTDAKQTNQALLLSRDATINTKPQLEIFADDVRCTHGATVGQLDADALFYLRSRGVPQEAARGLLTYAFANDVVERVRVEPLRRVLEELLRVRLPGSPESAAAARGEERG